MFDSFKLADSSNLFQHSVNYFFQTDYLFCMANRIGQKCKCLLLARQNIDALLFSSRKNRSHYSRKTFNILQEIVLFHGSCQEKQVGFLLKSLL